MDTFRLISHKSSQQIPEDLMGSYTMTFYT